MTFLLIVCAYVLCQFSPWRQLFHRDAWFQGLASRFSMFAEQSIWVCWVVVVLLPVLLLMIILSLVETSAVLVWLISLVVLMYALGRGEWRTEISAVVTSFAQQDSNVFRSSCHRDDLLMAGIDETLSPQDKITQLWRNFTAQALYRELEAFYAVFFWFFLLGAPGALLYRLSVMFVESLPLSEKRQQPFRYCLWLLEWLPVRLLVLLFGLVGNFSTLLKALKLTVLDSTLPSGVMLARCVESALFIDVDVGSETDLMKGGNRTVERVDDLALSKKTFQTYHRYSLAVQELMQRTEWAFFGALALLILIF